jgi:hypothetical protein
MLKTKTNIESKKKSIWGTLKKMVVVVVSRRRNNPAVFFSWTLARSNRSIGTGRILFFVFYFFLYLRYLRIFFKWGEIGHILQCDHRFCFVLFFLVGKCER